VLSSRSCTSQGHIMGQDQQAGMEIRPARAAPHLSTASCTRCTVAGEVTSSWPAGKCRADSVVPRQYMQQGVAVNMLRLAQASCSPAHTWCDDVAAGGALPQQPLQCRQGLVHKPLAQKGTCSMGQRKAHAGSLGHLPAQCLT
jgi:hypothetical protein